MTETETPRPADFDAYWDAGDQELARYPAAATLERLALASDEFSTVYALRLTSTGPYRIFGYLSVPPGQGPFPGGRGCPPLRHRHPPAAPGRSPALRDADRDASGAAPRRPAVR